MGRFALQHVVFYNKHRIAYFYMKFQKQFSSKAKY